MITKWINSKVEKFGWIFLILTIIGIPPDFEWWQNKQGLLMTNEIETIVMIFITGLLCIMAFYSAMWIWYKIEKLIEKLKSNKKDIKKLNERHEREINIYKDKYENWNRDAFLIFEEIKTNNYLTKTEMKSKIDELIIRANQSTSNY
jgi:low affinity Fe/Cu permease